MADDPKAAPAPAPQAEPVPKLARARMPRWVSPEAEEPARD